MKCPQCGRENRPDARFCKQCGHSLQEQAAPPPPTAASGTICSACGATAKPQARFCPRCGKPLAVPPGPQPSPTTPSPASTANTQPSMRPVSPPSIVPPSSPPSSAEPPTYTQPPYQSAPWSAPVPAERRPSRWMLWAGTAITVFCVVAFAWAAVTFGPELIGQVSTGESTATPIPAAVASPTTAPEPAPTVTPTLKLPTATPTAHVSAILAFDAQVAIAVSATELPAGAPLTITVTLTNTGNVSLSNLFFQLVGEPTPSLEWVSQEAMRYEGDVYPGATSVVTFTLRASQEGSASFQAYARMDAQTDPPSTESLLSEMHVVLVTPP